jgi:hypothetical protein
MKHLFPQLLVAACCFAVSGSTALGNSSLLSVSKGAIPNDTGSDGKTRMTIVKQDELGGDALKVEFAVGDSFGDRASKVRNWVPFTHLRFQAFNPGNSKVKIEFNVKHAQTTNYQTRIAWPIELKPGKNSIEINISELTNVNGSSPDLANVMTWYIANEADKAPTLYFADIRLEGAAAATTESAKTVKLSGDPARLARIRATPMPKVNKVIAFDTPEADVVLSALEVFPPDNPWNLIVSDWPLHPNSQALIASIGSDKVLRGNDDMCFVIVPSAQPKVDVTLVGYPGESDPGPFPVPDNLPIEGWPKWYSQEGAKRTLAEVQRRPAKYEGDRHAIILDPIGGKLYEFFVMGRSEDGAWAADQSSVFDLKSNRLRPEGWTSADAAGLPIFPGVVRYDELQRGEIEHAMRVTIRRSRMSYIYPATHHAGHADDLHLPRMGERFRLRQDFDTSGFSPTARTILEGLKKYGMLVADNGIEWAISIAPDPRIPDIHEELRKAKGADFEVVLAPAGYQPPGN